MIVSEELFSKTIGEILQQEELPIDFRKKHEKICQICAKANPNYDFDYYNRYFSEISLNLILWHSYMYDHDLAHTDKEEWRKQRLVLAAINIYRIIFFRLRLSASRTVLPTGFGLNILNPKACISEIYTKEIEINSDKILDAFIALSNVSTSVYHKQVVEPRFIAMNRSEQAIKAISTRHKKNAEENQIKKNSIIQSWQQGNPKTKAGWASISDAAAHISVETDKPYRTVYNWISQHEKQKRKS